MKNAPHVVIVGAGFGGLNAAKGLSKVSGIKITIIDKNNYHVFQPFLYQVATADLAPSDIAVPIRSQFKDNKNVKVVMSMVVEVDKEAKKVRTANGLIFKYDYLIIATGSESNFFGNDHWCKYVNSLKCMTDALRIRNAILEGFEKAEATTDINKRAQYMTFVIIGGGATGVELAGSIEELVKQSLKSDFTDINPAGFKVILIEAASRLLPTFEENLSDFAIRKLKEKGVEVMLGTKVENIEQNKVIISGGDSIIANLVIWAAGVKATNAKKMLGMDVNVGYGNRIKVNEDLSLPSYPEVFVIGDACEIADERGQSLPGLAAVASQQGSFVAKAVVNKIKNNGKQLRFKYKDRGNLAIVGRYSAVAEFKAFKLKGFIAWLIWDIVHIYFLIGFRNRLIVFIKWLWNYITHGRSERIIIKLD